MSDAATTTSTLQAEVIRLRSHLASAMDELRSTRSELCSSRAQLAEERAAWDALSTRAHVLPAVRRGGGASSFASCDTWRGVTERAELPPGFGPDSPVLAHLLESWCDDQLKHAYVLAWVKHIVGGKCVEKREASSFQQGMELSQLKPEIRDGFLSFLVPLLAQRADIDVVVQAKESLVSISDLRIKVMPVRLPMPT